MNLMRGVDNRGAFSWHVLFYTFVVITGFVILLFVFLQISFSGNVDREVCHQSVVFKGSLPDEDFLARQKNSFR